MLLRSALGRLLIGFFSTCALLALMVPSILCEAAPTKIAKPVSLQLTWHHQFQFAGYYAAAEKGFFKDEGLDVTIQEGSYRTSVVHDVVSGKVQFGVATSELIWQRLHGSPVVAVAAIFQHSPLALMSLGSSGISAPSDLNGKRVMSGFNERGAEIMAMLFQEGIVPERLKQMPVDGRQVDALISGRADAATVYINNEPELMQNRGVAYQLMRPLNYGVDFYGDTLFTSERYLESSPEAVAAFRRAALKGWSYAFDYPEEIAALIMSKYKSEHGVQTKEHLLFQAKAMEPLVLPALVEIGHMNAGRWEKMALTYKELGMISDLSKLEGFMYDPTREPNLAWVHWVAAAAALSFFVLVISVYFNLRMRHLVNERTRALDNKNLDLLREVAERKIAERAARHS